MIVLIGNPNSGKSSVFNILTGLNAKVGNYPGITIDLKEGKYKNKKIVDLPGIYSLNTYTEEEYITFKFLNNQNIDMIINVIDINNLNRSLYLTLQLIELKIPMIIVLNKADKKSKIKINISKLEKLLGLKVIKISTKEKLNIEQLKKNILINQKASNIEIKKMLNKEEDIINKYKLIDRIYSEITYNKKKRKIKIENMVLNKYFSLVTSIIIFLLMYLVGINIVGNTVVNSIYNVLSYLEKILYIILNNTNSSIIFKELIMKGIFPGITSILTFFPQIIILIFIMSLLEDSGYITYLSLIYHNLLKKIGLTGKSFLPLLFAFNCSVSAILSTRIIKSKKERLKTTFLIPFIPCSAKMNLIIFITFTFFKNSFFIFLSFYILSIFLIIILSLIFKKEKDDLILEIPDLKMPSFKIALKNTYHKIKSFFIRISTIILFTSIINFLLISFDFNLNYGVDFKDSILHFLLIRLSFLVKPFLGTSDIKSLFAIISGIIAKEQVISTITVLGSTLNVISAYSFCVFNILTIPCVNTLTCIKKEFGIKILLSYLIGYLLISYIVSIIIYRILIVIL